jgi:hypothetical protein
MSKNQIPMKALKEEAVRLAQDLLASLDDVDVLKSQLDNIEIEPINSINTMFEFIHSDNVIDRKLAIKTIAEGRFTDQDGVFVDVLLFTQDDRLYEIEYVKHSHDPIVSRPITAQFTHVLKLEQFRN